MPKILYHVTCFYYRSAFAQVFSIYVHRIIQYPELGRTCKDLWVQLVTLHKPGQPQEPQHVPESIVQNASWALASSVPWLLPPGSLTILCEKRIFLISNPNFPHQNFMLLSWVLLSTREKVLVPTILFPLMRKLYTARGSLPQSPLLQAGKSQVTSATPHKAPDPSASS